MCIFRLWFVRENIVLEFFGSFSEGKEVVVLNCDPFCKCFIAEVRGHKRRFTPVFCYKLCVWVLFFFYPFVVCCPFFRGVLLHLLILMTVLETNYIKRVPNKLCS